MHKNELIVRAKINNSGELITYAEADIEKFQNAEKGNGGCDLLIRMTKLPKKGKNKMIGYIHGKIYPEFIRAFRESGLRMTKAMAEEKVINLTTIGRGRKVEDLDFYELMELIEELKYVAAENFHFYIDDAIVI